MGGAAVARAARGRPQQTDTLGGSGNSDARMALHLSRELNGLRAATGPESGARRHEPLIEGELGSGAVGAGGAAKREGGWPPPLDSKRRRHAADAHGPQESQEPVSRTRALSRVSPLSWAPQTRRLRREILGLIIMPSTI